MSPAVGQLVVPWAATGGISSHESPNCWTQSPCTANAIAHLASAHPCSAFVQSIHMLYSQACSRALCSMPHHPVPKKFP